MRTCVRLLKSDTGHRVKGHEGKCNHVHGHEYRYEIEAAADDLDPLGRVIDFSVLKARVGKWIDDNWDHNFIAFDQDIDVIAGLERMKTGKEPFLLPTNPTAENLADYLLREVCPVVLADTGVKVTRVRVWETQNCYAEAKL